MSPRVPGDRTWHEVLEVPPDADDATIKRAFRRLAFQYMPGRPTGDEARFLEVNAAYVRACPAASEASKSTVRPSDEQMVAMFEAIQRQMGALGPPRPARRPARWWLLVVVFAVAVVASLWAFFGGRS